MVTGNSGTRLSETVPPPAAELQSILKALPLALVLAISACDADDLTSVTVKERLAFVTSISAAEVGPGQTMIFRYSLRNVSDAPVSVTFAGCTLLPYVRTESGESVYPGGGAWGCPGISPRVTLGPGEAMTRDLQITPGALRTFGDGSISLPAGRYRVNADTRVVIDEANHWLELRSPVLTFRVRD
jgi:hypothetical protein